MLRPFAIGLMVLGLASLMAGGAGATPWEQPRPSNAVTFQIQDEVVVHPLGGPVLTRTIHNPSAELLQRLIERLERSEQERKEAEAQSELVQAAVIKDLTEPRGGRKAWTSARFEGPGGSALRLIRRYADGECGFVSAESHGFERRYSFALHHYLKDELVGTFGYPLREGPWSDRHTQEVGMLDKMHANGFRLDLRVSLPGTLEIEWGQAVQRKGVVELDLLEPWPVEQYDSENNTFVASRDLDYFSTGFLIVYGLVFWACIGWLRRFRALLGR